MQPTCIYTIPYSCRKEFREQLQAQIKEAEKKHTPSPSTDEYEEAVLKDRAAKEQDTRELIEKAVFLKTFKEANKTASTSRCVKWNDRSIGAC